MQVKIYIVESTKGRSIIESSKIHNGHIAITHYDDDGEPYKEMIPVTILHVFWVLTQGKFIRNEEDDSKLNAYKMSKGFNTIFRLAYHWSASIVDYKSHHEIFESDIVWTSSGITSTQFDMYSYHLENNYQEDRLDYEIYQSLDLNQILSKYLTSSDIRNNKLNKLGI